MVKYVVRNFTTYVTYVVKRLVLKKFVNHLTAETLEKSRVFVLLGIRILKCEIFTFRFYLQKWGCSNRENRFVKLCVTLQR
ncbi:hypothetical protein AAU31_05985 [Listeria monocytogenes]|nr:hypothetical protein [Listeria monocytogenes]EAC7583010.1 hypothetical protein [Listeria monocytogenes]EAC7584834.1 hypothetical protein [Listeria monocytogenes]EAD6863319.1 hypothetical protein [Listeria monocytogenes]EAE1319691.1 hypothetical protein [Listeria monocytogenes]